jgi:GRASP55/65 PDZ-like domain
VDLTPSDSWGGAGLLGVTIRLDNYAGAEERLIRVLEVEDKSPAQVAGLIPFKDFLLGTTTTTLDSTDTLASLLYTHRDKIVELYVYNSDTDVVRVVALMPTLSWGGAGLLGAAVGTGYLHRLPSSTRNTEGSSVERKVRYVGVDTSNSSDGSGKTTIPALGTLSNKGLLELEPQLEMERDDSCDESQDASAADMSSVALSVDDATPTSRSSSASARGVVVETVAMNEPGFDTDPNHCGQPPAAVHQQQPAATWMEPVRLQERESSNTGRAVESHNSNAVDRDLSPEIASACVSGGEGRQAAEPQRIQQSPTGPPLPSSQAEAAIPPVKPSRSLLPPPPKMHYTAST